MTHKITDDMLHGYRFRTPAQTSNNNPQKPTSTGDILNALESLKELMANMRKFRYRTSEVAPMQPVISRTKSYEMVIAHPVALAEFFRNSRCRTVNCFFLAFNPLQIGNGRNGAKSFPSRYAINLVAGKFSGS